MAHGRGRGHAARDRSGAGRAGHDHPGGCVSLYTLPTPEGGKLIINKQFGQWGTQYDESKDLTRIDLKIPKTDQPYGEFTVVLEKNDKSQDPTAGYIARRWENTECYVEIAAKK